MLKLLLKTMSSQPGYFPQGQTGGRRIGGLFTQKLT